MSWGGDLSFSENSKTPHIKIEQKESMECQEENQTRNSLFSHTY